MKILREEGACLKCPADSSFKYCYQQQFDQDFFARVESSREEIGIMLKLIDSIEKRYCSFRKRPKPKCPVCAMNSPSKGSFSNDPTRNNGPLEYRISNSDISLRREGQLAEIVGEVEAILNTPC